MIDRLKLISVGVRINGNISRLQKRYMDKSNKFVTEYFKEGFADNIRSIARRLAKENCVAYGEINIPKTREVQAEIAKIKKAQNST